MKPVMNPLFVNIDTRSDNIDSTLVSTIRNHPLPKHKLAEVTSSRQTWCTPSCTWCPLVPWVPVLCALLTVGALVVWSVYMDRLLQSLLALAQVVQVLQQQHISQLTAAVGLLQTILVALVSEFEGLMLLLAACRKHQSRRRQQLLMYADAPRAWAAHCLMGAMVIQLLLFWVVSAALVCLLCLTFLSSALAFAGDRAAAGATGAQGVTTPNAAVEVTAQTADIRHAWTDSMSAVPAAVQRTMWFKAHQQHMKPLLQRDEIEGTQACPASCMNLSPLAGLLLHWNGAAPQACVCDQAAVLLLSQHASSMWRDGVAVLAALVTLLAVASWLLMYGVAIYTAARHDWKDAVFLQQQHIQPQQLTDSIKVGVKTSSSPDGMSLQLARLTGHASTSSEKQCKLKDWPVTDTMVTDVEQPSVHSDQLLTAPLALASGPADYDTPPSTAQSSTQHSRQNWQDIRLRPYNN